MQDIYMIDRQITVMCIIGGVMSLIALPMYGRMKLFALFMLVLIPLGCCILFWVTKHPAFGIIYTVLFFINRIPVFFFGGGTFLAAVIVILMLVYFIYIDYMSIYRRRELPKRQMEEMTKKYERSEKI